MSLQTVILKKASDRVLVDAPAAKVDGAVVARRALHRRAFYRGKRYRFESAILEELKRVDVSLGAGGRGVKGYDYHRTVGPRVRIRGAYAGSERVRRRVRSEIWNGRRRIS